MRTTVKRGMGRGASWRQPPPAPPPAPPTFAPMTRYRAPRRGLVGTLARALGWLAVTLLVAAGALAGGSWLYLNQSVAAVRADSPEAREAEQFLDVPLPGQPAVALVIGYDSRLGADKGNPPRSDTMMLVRADPDAKTVSMLSFPRDLVVTHPACRDHPEYRGRINEAFTNCGVSGALKTVKEVTGIPVNYTITVNYRSFKQIVNALGGVYLDVDRRYFNDRSGPGGYATINLQPGYQRVTGGAALDYVRYRHADSDLYRHVRQQEFVKAFKQQVASSFSLAKIPGIVKIVTDNVEVSVGGGGALDLDTVQSYARLLYELPVGNFHQTAIDGLVEIPGSYELQAPEEEIAAAVTRFMQPDARAAEKAASAATGHEEDAGPAAPPPAEVTVEVLNGNGVAGAADEAAYLLGERGYQAANAGNADAFDYFRTQVLYDPDVEGADLAAEAVAALFGDADVEAAPAGAEPGTTLRVVIGQTFEGTLGPGPRDRTPEQTPPAVEDDGGEAAALLRPAQRRVDFPVLAPSVREETSSLDGDQALRVYNVGGHDAVRLVYRTSTTEYWGIQQTSWTEAPILDGPSTTRTIEGREYKLYFSGPRLHTIAFEENGGVYWVVNTLLNQLSNETMIEIAKGLRPLSQ